MQWHARERKREGGRGKKSTGEMLMENEQAAMSLSTRRERTDASAGADGEGGGGGGVLLMSSHTPAVAHALNN